MLSSNRRADKGENQMKVLVVSQKVKNFVFFESERERLEEKNRVLVFPHDMNTYLKSYNLIYVWI